MAKFQLEPFGFQYRESKFSIWNTLNFQKKNQFNGNLAQIPIRITILMGSVQETSTPPPQLEVNPSNLGRKLGWSVENETSAHHIHGQRNWQCVATSKQSRLSSVQTGIGATRPSPTPNK